MAVTGRTVADDGVENDDDDDNDNNNNNKME